MNLKELYLEIYRSRPESILRFMLVSLFVWTLLTLLFGSLRATRRGWMWFNRILAGCAVLGILGITVFYRFIGGGGEVGINLVPFRVPEETWRAEEYYRMLLMNAFLFFPLGLSLGNAWRPERRILRRFGLTVLCGLALSLFCETMQGLFMLGTAEDRRPADEYGRRCAGRGQCACGGGTVTADPVVAQERGDFPKMTDAVCRQPLRGDRRGVTDVRYHDME